VDARNDHDAAEAARTIVTTRQFEAPADLVFAAWTDPGHLAQRWGPTGFTLTTHSHDFRPGGIWRFVMHGPDGTDYPNAITYVTIDPPRLLAYRHGGGGDATPVRFDVTVTFEARGDQTILTMRAVFPSAAARDEVVAKYGAIEGAKQTLERLASYLLIKD